MLMKDFMNQPILNPSILSLQKLENMGMDSTPDDYLMFDIPPMLLARCILQKGFAERR